MCHACLLRLEKLKAASFDLKFMNWSWENPVWSEDLTCSFICMPLRQSVVMSKVFMPRFEGFRGRVIRVSLMPRPITGVKDCGCKQLFLTAYL